MSSTDPTTPVNWVWTPQLLAITVWISVAPTIASILTALVVLGLALRLYLSSETRHALRRQSFMMLLSVLVMSLPYSASYMLEVLLAGPTPWCAVSMFFGLLTANFIQFVVTLIAVNLQMVFVHGIRTEGFFKWYLSGSFLLALVISLPGTIKGVWGWDPLLQCCYTALVDPNQRFLWQIASAYFWSLFTAFVTLVSTLVVLGSLAYHSLNRRRLLSITQRTHNNVFNDTAVAIAWRITLYPLILIIFTSMSAASDFSIDKSVGISSWTSFVLWCIYGFLYGAQPLLYCLVAIFVDPSFSGAVRQVVKSDLGSVGACASYFSTSSPTPSVNHQDGEPRRRLPSDIQGHLANAEVPQRPGRAYLPGKSNRVELRQTARQNRDIGSLWSTIRTASEDEIDQM
ncbi:hypothetical protein JAAARDRAFT_54928 [Jaapia argillacea MUCL 33604]|uniref:G-protein coupled receptors family 1 profile domain-containing protein n=1 Tax=Jaapia argillacea MUCL 33604 TaxID=933084 RepID=A0A067Q5X5_9AGAM|nr:hypothetical protein JAAARDRAFT_54928 [Jaapia argillacea MUCL 33604]